MSEATVYDDFGVGGPGAGTAVGDLDFCEACRAGGPCCGIGGRDADPGSCECDGLCATRAAKGDDDGQA